MRTTATVNARTTRNPWTTTAGSWALMMLTLELADCDETAAQDHDEGYHEGDYCSACLVCRADRCREAQR